MQNARMTADRDDASTFADTPSADIGPAASPLHAAIEAMRDGCAVFDAADRLVFCNAAFRIANAAVAELLAPGARFDELLRESVRRGRYDLDGLSAEAFVERRLARRARPESVHEQRLADGRWEEAKEQRLPDGGTLLLTADVTARATAATELARKANEIAVSDRRFRDYADASADWFWETDAELRYSYMDERSYTLINQPTQSRIGKRRDEVTDLDLDKPHWRQHLADLAARRPFRDFRYRARTVDGALRWISASGKPIFDASGVFQGYRGAARDVTEEVASQTQVNELQRRLFEAVDSFPDAFVYYDADERLLLYNQRYAGVYSGHADVLRIGRRFEEMLRIGVERGDFPDAVGREDAWVAERLRRFRNPGEPFEQQLSNGRWLRILERRTADGGLIGVRTDITELVVARADAQRLADRNAALAAAVDNFGDSISLFDAEERLVFWNRAYAEAYPPGEPLLQPGTSFMQMMLRSLEVGRPAVPPELREDYIARRLAFHRAPDGVLERQTIDGRWQHVREHRLPDGSQLVVISDVTRRRHTEAQLHQAQKMEAVGQLTGGLAHDMNNLLGVVIGNLERARELVDHADAREALGDAIAAAERGGELNRQLLAFARRQPLRPTRVNPNDVVTGMSRLAGRMIGETIRVRIDASPDAWPIEIDRAQLESAILNLAVNARDAMPQGGRLTIATENVTVGPRSHAAPVDLMPGDYVAISVTDTGVGMPPDVLAHVFEPFFTTKEVGQGSGLGLSQVYGFINQSQGRVQIESGVGIGTVITLYIPRAPERHDIAPSDTGAAATDRRAALVLVVDDNEELRQIVVQQVRQMGYRTLEAEDAAAGLALLRSRDDIDLLFTDIVLPGGMDGRALARAARALRADIRLLFMSGFADLDGTSGDMPGVELLAKPFRRAALAHTLRKILSQ